MTHPKNTNINTNSDLKKIAFIATGSEIIQGDLLESNCKNFATQIHEHGGAIYQHMHVSDQKNEIINAIEYLLKESDAVIITGGLGPTSDDNTRFAIADFMQTKLNFNEEIWSDIKRRLTRFKISISDANRQQAFFPTGATIYKNELGTASGFSLKKNHKIIISLPGPPKECLPLFNKYILSYLKEARFFQYKRKCRWLTLGLSEAETAAKIDEIVAPYECEAAYRWHYPYLEIKVSSQNIEHAQDFEEKIDSFLKSYIVSKNNSDAMNLVAEKLASNMNLIFVQDQVTTGDLWDRFQKQYPEKISKFLPSHSQKDYLFLFKASKDILSNENYSGSITFTCEGFLNQNKIYTHSITVSYRGAEVLECAEHYAAWQLFSFINTTPVSEGKKSLKNISIESVC